MDLSITGSSSPYGHRECGTCQTAASFADLPYGSLTPSRAGRATVSVIYQSNFKEN